MPGFDDLHFDHWYLEDLPGDRDESNQRRQVTGAAWSLVAPTPTGGPRLAAHSHEMSQLLGFDADCVASNRFASVFSGNAVVDGMAPHAMNYGGHQFGNWAGQLGDGRAIALGEVDTSDGGHQVLQLKGAGPTPYSRSGDGRAVLRSSVREFLCSEAMHHLGVATTRALSLTLTGDDVMRDMLYDGHPELERGAVVCRVAPSFVRFGHFELPAARGESELLRALVEHTIRRHFPHLVRDLSSDATLDNDTIAAMFEEVAMSTADLMVDWMRVGFVHGVMNTDNLSILGLTIDYGPYGWLDDFDPGWTPNTTDASMRRYRYGNQPQIALWNLARLGGALHALTDDAEPLQATLDDYSRHFEAGWDRALAAKLGLCSADAVVTKQLTDEILEILPATETDMTIFFRQLGDLDLDALGVDAHSGDLVEHLAPAYYRPDEMTAELTDRTATWLRNYRDLSLTTGNSAAERTTAMHAVNPKYVLRNYLAQLAIDKADTGDFGMIDGLLDVLRRPYEEQPEHDTYATKRPDWARERVGCSQLSCSS